MKPTHYRYRDMLQGTDEPDTVITRAQMAATLRQYRQHFELGRAPGTFAIWINGIDRRVFAPIRNGASKCPQ